MFLNIDENFIHGEFLNCACTFKLLLLQNFSSQSKLLLQWKHFLKINYAMFQTKPKVLLCSKGTGPMKENFIPNSMGRFFLMSRNVWKKTLIPAGSLVWTEFPEKTKRIPALIDYMVKSIFEAFAKSDKKKHPRIVQREKQKSLVWMVLCFVHLKTHAKSVLFFALKFYWRFLFFLKCVK